MRIAIGSTNPVKIRATKKVLRKIFNKAEVIPVKVDSGVEHTPLSEEEAIKGAINRAEQAIRKANSDFGVGMEGGITKKFDRYFLQGWCAVIDKKGRIGLGGGSRLELPSCIVQEVLKGKELGNVMDELTGMKDSKRSVGAVGILTNGLTNRQKAWEQALIYAMSKWLKPDLYAKEGVE